MRNFKLALIFLTILFACNSPKPKLLKQIKTNQEILVHLGQKRPLPPFLQWISSAYYPYFTSNGTNDTIFITYNGQCGYYYPVIKKSNKLIVLFSNDMDCTHDIGIESNYGLRKFPKLNEPFMEFRYLNDSLINVKHLFPQWADSVNAQYPPIPCFVDSFRLIDLNSKQKNNQ